MILGGSLNFFPLGAEQHTDDFVDTDGIEHIDVPVSLSYFMINISLQAGYVWSWDVIAISLVGGIAAIIDLRSENIDDSEVANVVDFDGSFAFDRAQLLGLVGAGFHFFIRRWLSFDLNIRMAMGSTLEYARFQYHTLVGMALNFHI